MPFNKMPYQPNLTLQNINQVPQLPFLPLARTGSFIPRAILLLLGRRAGLSADLPVGVSLTARPRWLKLMALRPQPAPFCLPETKQECSPPEVSVYRPFTSIIKQGLPPAHLFRGTSQDRPDDAFNQPSCGATCFSCRRLHTEGIAQG